MKKQGFRFSRGRATTAALISSAMLAAVFATALPADAVSPSIPGASTGTISAADENADTQQVAQFVAANPAPVLRVDSSSAAFLAFSVKVETYWKATPWSAVYGQQGCTVLSQPQIEYHATAGSWGAAGTSLSVAVQCPTSATGLAAISSSAVPAATQTDSIDSGARVVSPQIEAPYLNMNCAESGSNNGVCVGMPYLGYLYGSEENFNSQTEYGHIHLGQVGACGAGTTVGNSGDENAYQNAYDIYDHTISVDSRWVTQWYDPGETAEVCGAY